MALALAQTPVVSGTAAAGTSLTTGTLASVPTTNNLLVMALQVSDNATTITTPTGYTLLSSILREGSASIAVYTKVCDGTDATTNSFSWGNSANAESLYAEISGNSTSTPIEAAVTNSAFNANSASPSVTGSAATTDTTEMIVCVVGSLGKPTHSVPLDSLTIDVQGQSAGGTATTGASICFMHKTLAGSNETPTTGDTLSVSRNWGAWVFAVKASAGVVAGSTPKIIVSNEAQRRAARW